MSAPGRVYAPELFPTARLAAADFDETVARTFTPAPSGIGVNEAYASAIDTLYGPSSLDDFHATGGLRNRAAFQVVRDLFPDMSDDELVIQAQRVTDHKLTVMLGQIDDQWPLPTQGFIECWNRIAQRRQQGMLIDTAVISAGIGPSSKRHLMYGEYLTRTFWSPANLSATPRFPNRWTSAISRRRYQCSSPSATGAIYIAVLSAPKQSAILRHG